MALEGVFKYSFRTYNWKIIVKLIQEKVRRCDSKECSYFNLFFVYFSSCFFLYYVKEFFSYRSFLNCYLHLFVPCHLSSQLCSLLFSNKYLFLYRQCSSLPVICSTLLVFLPFLSCFPSTHYSVSILCS